MLSNIVMKWWCFVEICGWCYDTLVNVSCECGWLSERELLDGKRWCYDYSATAILAEVLWHYGLAALAILCWSLRHIVQKNVSGVEDINCMWLLWYRESWLLYPCNYPSDGRSQRLFSSYFTCISVYMNIENFDDCKCLWTKSERCLLS